MRLSVTGKARLAAVFELLEGTTSTYGQLTVISGMVVAGDALATANNVRANETLFRFAIALSLLSVVFHIAWGVLLYDLLKAANALVARYMLVALAVTAVLQVVAALPTFAALIALAPGDALAAFTPEQRDALAFVFLRSNLRAYDIYLAFFGVWLISIGYLFFRTNLIPRLISVGLMLEGLAWMAYLSPPLGAMLFPVVIAFGLIGELPLEIYMLVRGVRTIDAA